MSALPGNFPLFKLTISYYDKGPVLGWMLDLAIRHATAGTKSLDDLMRLLYHKYYLKKDRGFTEKEFQMESVQVAGTSLTELFTYASTVKPGNYPKYFAYAGLQIDTLLKKLPGNFSGIKTVQKEDTLQVKTIEWNSPAWLAGLKAKDIILTVNDTKPNSKVFEYLVKTADLQLVILHP